MVIFSKMDPEKDNREKGNVFLHIDIILYTNEKNLCAEISGRGAPSVYINMIKFSSPLAPARLDYFLSTYGGVVEGY
jgi:hypothetical protein